MFDKRYIDRALDKIYNYVSGFIIVTLGKPTDLAEYVYDKSYIKAFDSIIIRKNSNFSLAKRFIACLHPLKDEDIEYIIKKKELGVVDVLACNRYLKKKKHIDALIESESYDVLSKLAGNINLMPEHIDRLINTNKSEILYNLVRYHPLTEDQIGRVINFILDSLANNKHFSGYILIPLFKNQNISDKHLIKILQSKASSEAYYQAIKKINAKKS
jgi:hypothetical protein